MDELIDEFRAAASDGGEVRAPSEKVLLLLARLDAAERRERALREALGAVNACDMKCFEIQAEHYDDCAELMRRRVLDATERKP